MQNKDAVELFTNSNCLKNIVNDHMVKMLLGPSYKGNSNYESKLEQLEKGELDETYCFLYMNKDIMQPNFKASSEDND